MVFTPGSHVKDNGLVVPIRPYSDEMQFTNNVAAH